MVSSYFRSFRIEAQERVGIALAFAYFFCLLCGYYLLRPVREEMGVQGGIANLKWLFTAVFVAMLAITPVFGWLAARLPRQRLLPTVYVFFALNLIVFYVFWRDPASAHWIGPVFFVWVSVFNLFVVSVFWSFMADLFTLEQSERLYGPIAAGGSLGAITGPLIATSIVQRLGIPTLLLVSCGFLILCIVCIVLLARWARRVPRSSHSSGDEVPLGGRAWDGVMLVLRSPYLLLFVGYIFLHSIIGTLLYFEQNRAVGAALSSPAERTALFAKIDLIVNIVTVLVQIFALSALVKRIGVAWALALLPLLALLGFAVYLASPTLSILIALMVARRAGEYAIARPAREMLFTVLPRAVKYKAKNFLDTTVFRGADATSGWLVDAMRSASMGAVWISLIGIPIAVMGAYTGWRLGRSRTLLQAEVNAHAADSLSPTPSLAHADGRPRSNGESR